MEVGCPQQPGPSSLLGEQQIVEWFPCPEEDQGEGPEGEETRVPVPIFWHWLPLDYAPHFVDVCALC